LHLPTGCIDRRNLCTVAEAEAGKLCTIKVKVLGHTPSPRYRKSPWKIDTEDATGHLELAFFNAGKWIEKKFPVGSEVYVSGKVEAMLTEKQILHPESFPASMQPNTVARIWTTYPLTAGVTQATASKAVAVAMATMNADVRCHNEWLPDELRKNKGWPSFAEALHTIHKPQDPDDIEHEGPARQRLAFDEMLAWQIGLIRARKHVAVKTGVAHPPAMDLRHKMLETLPFELTGDQKKVILEIDEDMMRPTPMLRLLQGDVGAGKTVVAFAAAVRAVAGGYQVAMMAPTEILATQHYLNAQKMLEPLGIKCALLTGKMKAAERKPITAAIESGEIQVVFGTHALIQKKVNFNRLSLAIIDEQHRFGVRQRLALSDKGLTPDVLVMTATPIPRTLALTAYGDMDISILREKPPGRTPIHTTVMATEKIGQMVEALERVINLGEQAYWVCPLVEESEKSDLAAATQRFEQLQQRYGDQVVLLHGRMKPAEKEEVMADFKAGKYMIMVATTVIEVGIDVPQATTMIIEHAERFGLSQLHQLRGRVGRGSDKSHCILLYAPPLGHFSTQRLQVMRDTDDGFIIAEKDLDLRGPGEALGTQQAGHWLTKVANLESDKELIQEAREVAQRFMAQPMSDEQKANLDFLLEIFNRHEAATLIKSG
tara:strand:+ start:353023 stop:354993 length:1971 start_codon:yes stop_codon:yes gene_type:complete